MPDREGFPAGVPAWIDTAQPDPDEATQFYGGLFGWEFEDRTPPGADGRYVVGTLDGKRVAGIGSPFSGASTPAWTTYVAVDSADATAERAREAGGSVLEGPIDVGDLGRVALCADPAGASFGIWQAGTVKGAELVNSPGAWNFSNLHTRDVDTASRFYGSVFGWEVDQVDMGGMAGTMVRLPGYADFLEQFNPGIRQRHADFGAPPGFTECVAWIEPLTDETAARWGVTFTVADTDAVAAKAREVGGSVVAEPFDMPPSRVAVLRDPAGAEFTAASFNPG